jgi:CubicO group peptidase (beta-lactamase class C family)
VLGRKTKLAILLVLGAALAAPAGGQNQDQARYQRALAAGYKASFLCSDIFNAGMTEAQVERDDLQRTYPELVPLMGGMKAAIDRQARTVSVAWDEAMPPRVAAWRPYLGCAQLPIGASAGTAVALPQLSVQPRQANMDALPWPMGDRKALARPRGDARALGRAMVAAFDRRTYGQGSETTAVVVVQNGRIVAERYRDDFNMHMSQRTWSVAKSIAGTLIGVAAHQQRIEIAAPAPVPEWMKAGDPRRQITTDHLLRMASGLHSDTAGNRTDAIYFGGTSVTEQATGWPLEAPPGSRFRYANNDTMLAARALRSALGDGQEALAFPFTQLFWRIGMTRTIPETDWEGNFILSSQVWTTARDLARLGLLYLGDGMWAGERILPPGWGRYVSSPGPAQPARGNGYGATFWTFPKESGLPDDAYAARGNRGQYLIIVPSRQIAIVRRGFDGGESAFDVDGFARDVLAALR